MSNLEQLLATCTTDEQRLTLLRETLAQLNGAREIAILEGARAHKAEAQRDALLAAGREVVAWTKAHPRSYGSGPAVVVLAAVIAGIDGGGT